MTFHEFSKITILNNTQEQNMKFTKYKLQDRKTKKNVKNTVILTEAFISVLVTKMLRN